MTDIATCHPAAAGLSPRRLGLIGDAMRREIDAGRLPGAVVGIVRRGQVAYLEAFGHADPVARTAMPTNALFSIASMTKPMVSVVILQLFEEARLLLGDPVAKYLPELANLVVATPSRDGGFETKPAKRNPTIQDLLCHTSGWSYQERGTSPACKVYPGSSISASIKMAKPDFLAALAKAPLLFEPGTDWEYGFSTDVLGLVIEAIEGRPLGAVMADRLWRPLGMKDAQFLLPAAEASRYARAFVNDPYTGERQAIVHHASPKLPQWESGGGGGLSTATDYLRFALMLLGRGTLGSERILGRKTVALMTADHLLPSIPSRIADTMDPAAAGYGFGLGFAVRRQTGISALAGTAGDYYWSGVYGTYFWADPTEDLATVLLISAPGQNRLRYRQMLRALVYQAVEE